MSEQFGAYELIQKIATGGMAEIYLARSTGLAGVSRRVVVKRMLPQLAVREDFVTMFLDEARLAANLVHPNVVQVFSLGEVDGAYFMAMELIDGPHLGALFAHSLRQRNPLPIELCVYVIARAADGLDYAHDHADPVTGQRLNIVHRDISPQNVLVSRHGDVKVTDFGVAKAETQQTKTRTGIIKGKVSYMSPEQCHGEDLDRRTDVFALGVVLYELLTRRRLYREKSDLLVMQRITTEDLASPSAVNPAVDPELDAITLQALSKAREGRFQTAAEMSEALDVWLAAHGHADGRAQLQRWMATHAEDLGVGAVDEPATPSAPGWSLGASAAAVGGASAEGSAEGIVSVPAPNAVSGPTASSAPPSAPPSAPEVHSPDGAPAESTMPPHIEAPSVLDTQEVPALSEGPWGLEPSTPPEPILSRRLPLAALAGGGAAVALAVVGVLWTSGLAPAEEPAAAVTGAGAAPPAPPVPPSAAPAEASSAAASEGVRLAVETDPAGVPVLVQDKVAGESPLELRLPPGEVEVSAVFPAQEPVLARVALQAGQPAKVRLVARVPLLVRSSPPGAELSIDGEAVGATPKEGLWLEPGKPVRLALSKPGYLPWSAELTPKPSESVVIGPELRRRPSSPRRPPRAAARSGVGKLRVDCRPWADVYIDGSHVGVTPTSLVKLKVGRHRVKVVNRDLGFSKTTAFEMRKDAVVTLGFKFKKRGEQWVFDAVVR